MTSMFSWQNSINLWSASFCTLGPNLPVILGISGLRNFAFQFPMMKRTSFLVWVLEGVIGFHRNSQFQLLQHQWLEHRLGLLWFEWFALEMNWDPSVVFELAPKYRISDSFVDCKDYSISSKRFLFTIVGPIIMWIEWRALVYLKQSFTPYPTSMFVSLFPATTPHLLLICLCSVFFQENETSLKAGMCLFWSLLYP